MTTKAQTRNLAIEYHAYLGAVDKEDVSGIFTWGIMLKETQEKTGVFLCDPASLAWQIERADLLLHPEAA